MNDFQIKIPGRKRPDGGSRKTIRLSSEAYEALLDIYEESTLSIKEIASLLIVEASKHVTYSREE